MVEVVATAEAAAVEEVRAVRAVKVKLAKHQAPSLGTEGQSIQISLLASGQGATCTISSGKIVISVLNLQPAHGKIFTPPGQPNETGTSSAKIPSTQN